MQMNKQMDNARQNDEQQVSPPQPSPKVSLYKPFPKSPLRSFHATVKADVYSITFSPPFLLLLPLFNSSLPPFLLLLVLLPVLISSSPFQLLVVLFHLFISFVLLPVLSHHPSTPPHPSNSSLSCFIYSFRRSHPFSFSSCCLYSIPPHHPIYSSSSSCYLV